MSVQKKQLSPAVIQGLSGATGALLATISTYPLLTFSTLQATTKKSKQEKKDERNSLLKEVAQLMREEGAGVLFRGLGPSLIGTVVSQGIYFYLYAYFKSIVLEMKRSRRKGKHVQVVIDLSVIEASVVAFLSGCCNVVITNPIWVIATRMQTTKKQDKNNLKIFKVIIDIYKDYGLFGFWKGVVPSLAMVSNPVIQYSLYEFLCNKWRQSKLVSNVKKLSPGEIFVLSGLAKMGSTVATYPMLVVKSRLQAASKKDESLGQYSSASDAVIKILQQEGFGGFYKGMKAKMFQSVLAASIMFMTKEQLTEVVQDALLKIQGNVASE